MSEKTKVYKVSLMPSVMEEVRELGKGKFAAGLAVLLAQATPKGGTKPTRKEDPDHPGESYQQRDKRVREAHANSPDVRREKMRSEIEHYVKTGYYWHHGVIDETTMYESPTYDSKGFHTGYLSEVRIMDYITPEERDAWVLESIANYKAKKAKEAAEAAIKKPTGPRPTLSADSKYMYQNFPALLANLTDEQIETMNEECDGAIDREADPYEPNDK
jgi:hypothetical protein